ncbi:MAG: Uma2 family endonuclease [Gemmataceae bacterium]|nr:Uma2 family endonuclease [Gemmataceae bacterium]
MATAAVKIGPADHGRRMSLTDFEHAEVEEGYLYELGRGMIVVSDVPNLPHLAQVTALRRQLGRYDLDNPGRIHTIASGNECKILVAPAESERHPDLAVYKEPPPEEDVWSTWIPELLIEVVSPGSEHRDYVEKREEYLRFGVREYWIVDAAKREVLVLRRVAGEWRERVLRPPEVYRTRVLPGFEFACEPVFDAADAAPR